MSGSPPVASRSDMFSAENLARVLARIDELEAQSSAAREQLAKQERKIEDLEMKAMILQAKFEGQEDAFFLFSRLPPEVREMIWKQALMPGRVIEVGVRDRKLTRIYGQYKTRPHVTRGNESVVPFPIFFDISAQSEALLYACHESRSVAQKPSELCFTFRNELDGIKSFFAENTSPGAAAISFQMFAKMGILYRPQFDSIFLRIPDDAHASVFFGCLCYKVTNGFEFGSITCLAVDMLWLGSSHVWQRCFTSLRGPPMLASLQKLIIVDGVDEKDWKDGIWFDNRKFNSPGSVKAAVVKELNENCPLMVALKVEIMTEQELMAMY